MTAPLIKIMAGDVMTHLAELPSESVHCCVTSPPYWGLRDYKVEGQLGLEPTPEEYISKMVRTKEQHKALEVFNKEEK